jgi:hypothetical protein
MGCSTGESWSIQMVRNFSSQHPDWPWGHIHWAPIFFNGNYSARGLKLIADFCLIPKLMFGAIPSLAYVLIAWWLIKHMGNLFCRLCM